MAPIEESRPDGPDMDNGVLPAEEAFKWAEQAMEERRWQVAARRWATLRMVYPDHPRAWVRGCIALKKMDAYSAAASLLERMRQRFPENSFGWSQGVLMAIQLDQLQVAEKLLSEARRRFQSNQDVLYAAASVAAVQGDYPAAEAYSHQVMAAVPEVPSGYIQHAELAMQAGDWHEALRRWQVLRERFPNEVVGYHGAARAHEALGESDAARELLLAAQYGEGWLESVRSGTQDYEDRTPPFRRRSWRTFLELVWTKARLNLKSEASRNHLRYLWWVIDPLLYMSVFFLVFGLLMQRGGEGFIGYLLTGLVPFQWFAKTIQHTSNSILAGKGLMQQVRISPLFFPLVGIVQNAGKQGLVFLMLAIFLILYGMPPTIHWLALLPVILLQLLVMTVLCCLVAMVVPFAKDILNLVPTGIQFLLFASGIFYPVSDIPEVWRTLFFLNPVANIIYQYRLILVEQSWPDWGLMLFVALGALFGLVVVILLYRRLESAFPKVVIE